jgi:hypothetical protein
MIDNALFHALLLVGFLWLCMSLYAVHLQTQPTKRKPAQPVQKRSRDPKPFPGLTHKPHCACAPQLLYLRHPWVGPQTTRTELYAKQRWTRDFPAGIIARDHPPISQKDTLPMTRCTSLLRTVMPLACTLLRLLGDVGRFLLLCLRPSHTLAAENLFLRKQLALYQERGVKPTRATNATRLTLVWLARWCDWRQALAVVQPATLIRWHR